MPDFTGPLSHHIHSTEPVPYIRAQKWINAYTARSQQYPHMHPDALFSRKIMFGTNGASGGVTITQLRKVSKGLSGERMTPEPEAIPQKQSKDQKFGQQKKSFHDEPQKEKDTDGSKQSEWEDPDEWAEERGGDEIGEVGEPHNYVGQVERNASPEVVELPVKDGTDADAQTIDKAERKKRKAEKQKAEKKEREAKRRKDAVD